MTKYAASQTRIKGDLDAVRRVYRKVCAEKEVEKMAMTTADVISLEARRKGRAEGKAEGIAKGIAGGKAEIIIDILTVRFGKIPASLAKKITSVQDSARLSELGKCVVTCTTLNDFKKMLR